MNGFIKRLGLVLSSLTFFTFTLAADDETEIDLNDYSQQNIAPSTKPTPFSLSVKCDAIGKADIKNGFFKKDSIQFSEGEAELGFTFYYCPAYTEGANAAISYTSTLIRWQNNPWFNQEHFNNVTFSLGGFSKRLHRWFWRGQMGVNIDANQWNFSEYATYDFLFWGRYEYCKHIGLHVGLIAQTGMKMDRVYPILGADWQVSRNWKLNLVFPLNVSLEYILNPRWSIALAGRNFDSRYRTKDETKAVLRYQNVGAEIAVKYEDSTMSVNIHAGSTLGGSLRIANRHNDHPHHYKLEPSAYAGAETTIKF